MAVNITPSKPQPKPTPLTTDERDRLARYEDTPDSAKDEAALLDELRLRTCADAWNRYRIAQTIRTLLPAGVEVRRGLVTDVTDASPYKREYVGRIRDGLAANYLD
ncbi:hypothetical protein JHN59_40625 [Streptomyces sp. MBT49]|uniref:hypothetical protein n=1 Tax=unclassified Streptomyces TaxID=2593676 RepID=UPI00190C7E09|nr:MULTISPECIES: hypothetical protein [unclassified Streptomyces]MBK3630984.1 hypothetical protein [Streptomyces sp. MBT49]MBK3637847.1 hypothetical protein [Streptomyces sp. MBT97]